MMDSAIFWTVLQMKVNLNFIKDLKNAKLENDEEDVDKLEEEDENQENFFNENEVEEILKENKGNLDENSNTNSSKKFNLFQWLIIRK